MIENESFNEYVLAFKKLSLDKKKEMVNKEAKKTLAFIEKMKSDFNIKSNILFNREILDLHDKNVSDDDFVEAMFVYIYSIQESIALYFNEMSKILYKNKEELWK